MTASDIDARLEEARRLGDEGDSLRQLQLAQQLEAELPQEARVEIVVALVLLSRFDEAEQTYGRLGPLSEELADRVNPYMAYGWLLAGDKDRAASLLARLKRETMPSALARSRFAQAEEQPVRALVLAEQAVALARTPDMMVMAEYHRGYLWLDVGLPDRAVKAFNRAIELAVPGMTREAKSHVGASLAHRERGDLKRAEHHAQAAIAMHEARRQPFEEGQARLVLAETLRETSASSEALFEVDRALQCLESGESPLSKVEAWLLRGLIWTDLGEPERARLDFERVLAEPRAAMVHDRARIQLAAMGDVEARTVLATWLDEVPTTPDRHRAELERDASWVLAVTAQDDGDSQGARHWFQRHSEATSMVGAFQAERRCRATEVLGQLEASRQEQLRADELAGALATQRKLRRAAEAAEAERRDLLELVAHDLRNPLSALALMLDEVPELESLQEIQSLLATGTNAVRNMRLVLDEAIDASEALSKPDTFEPIRVSELVRRAQATFGGAARAKGQTLRSEGSDGQVLGSKALLQSAVDNLVSNALKFSAPGETVALRVSPNEKHITVSVQDSGPGLVGDEPRRVFDRRVTGHARPTAGEPSTGLGLYLVRRIVEAHGGEVGAHSDGAGRGSTFWIRLTRLS
ncbi:MAG: HAMP domain-containing sensor histidine kinase [Myxococcota bacterium]